MNSSLFAFLLGLLAFPLDLLALTLCRQINVGLCVVIALAVRVFFGRMPSPAGSVPLGLGRRGSWRRCALLISCRRLDQVAPSTCLINPTSYIGDRKSKVVCS